MSEQHIGNTRPNLHFFQYLESQVPYTDPVPPSTKQYRYMLTIEYRFQNTNDIFSKSKKIPNLTNGA